MRIIESQQCAAVKTCLGPIKVPPQDGLLCPQDTNPTCHRIEFLAASSPPTILPGAIPQSINMIKMLIFKQMMLNAQWDYFYFLSINFRVVCTYNILVVQSTIWLENLSPNMEELDSFGLSALFQIHMIQNRRTTDPNYSNY